MTVYVYRWKNDPKEYADLGMPPKRPTLYKRRCRVLARGKKNSALVEFIDNGQREVVSRNALRKPKDTE